MQGTLAEFTVAELLQLFALAERTGTITVQTGDAPAWLYLESGRVVGMGNESFDVYSEIVACELLPARTGSALESISPVPGTPGLSFIVKNLIEPERWDLFTRRCLEQEIFPILSRQQGSFDVRVERIPPCPVSLSIPVQQLVLDGSRWEAEMAEHRVDGFGVASTWIRAPEAKTSQKTSSVEWLTWALLEEPMSIGDLARRICVPDLDATHAVRRLHASGMLTSGS